MNRWHGAGPRGLKAKPTAAARERDDEEDVASGAARGRHGKQKSVQGSSAGGRALKRRRGEAAEDRLSDVRGAEELLLFASSLAPADEGEMAKVRTRRPPDGEEGGKPNMKEEDREEEEEEGGEEEEELEEEEASVLPHRLAGMVAVAELPEAVPFTAAASQGVLRKEEEVLERARLAAAAVAPKVGDRMCMGLRRRRPRLQRFCMQVPRGVHAAVGPSDRGPEGRAGRRGERRMAVCVSGLGIR